MPARDAAREPPAPIALRLPTRRDLRLVSGLVLFTYVALHLTNHALGLVSVSLAERGLGLALRLWHSGPGTVLLYGSAAVHVVLALESIYQRRTLRMPPLDGLRIALGLGIPTLLIGHVVGTRVAFESYDVSPEYARVVWSLWMSDGEGRQLAMLVPGWLHGCLGVYFAFGRRQLFQRLRYLWFAIALLLPVLGGLGFLSMGKELASNLADRHNLELLAQVSPTVELALERMRVTVLIVYFGAIVAVFAAREIRALVEHRRKLLVNITYPGRLVQVPRGWSVLEASRSHHIAHMSMCGGRARCTTCRVRVTSGVEHCPPPEANEQAALTRIGAAPDVRLACQLRPVGDVALVPLLAPHGSARTRGAPTLDRDVALVLVTWRNRAAFSHGRLPQDVVYLARLFGESVSGAMRSAGCDEADVSSDHVLALFGIETSLTQACRNALQAADAAQRTLQHLEERCMGEFGACPQFAVVVHAGHAVVGHIGTQEPQRLVVAGDAADTLKAMQTAADDACVIVSANALEAAGEVGPGTVWREFAGIKALQRSWRAPGAPHVAAPLAAATGVHRPGA